MAEMTKDELLEALFIAKTGNSIDGRIAANFAKQGITDDSALPKPTLPSCCGVENHGNAYVYVQRAAAHYVHMVRCWYRFRHGCHHRRLWRHARPLVAEQDNVPQAEDGESVVKHGVEFRKSTFWNK